MSTDNPKDATCQDDYDPNSLIMDEALRRITLAIHPLTESETVTVHESLDRVLSENVLSTINVPSYTNSAMDGYAIRADDLSGNDETRLKIIGKAMAGHPFNAVVNAGEAVRIMTGAPMPQGADTVIMQEHVAAHEQTIVIGSGHRKGQNVRHAGEDMAIGSVALAKGKRITPADMGLVASLGIARVSVVRKLRVAFFSTGDELRSLGEPLGQGQIYDSNRYTLYGMLKRMNVDLIDMGIIADEQERLRDALQQASVQADAVITTGGVSVGEADFIKQLLEELGEVNFWKIAMKPGRPLTFGTIGNAGFFGLPGNPVSAMVTFYQFVKPALLRMSGHDVIEPTTVRMRCLSPLKKAPGRVEFQRGILVRDENNEWCVKTTGHQGSHVLSSMSQADCFIVLPMETGNLDAGNWVDVQPFGGIL